MKIKDVKVGEKYWWNDPCNSSFSGVVRIMSINGSGEDAVISCKTSYGSEVEAYARELDYVGGDA